MRGPPMRGKSTAIRWARAFLSVLPRSGPNFLRMKSGRLLMGGPPTSDFFFAAAGTDPEELVEMVGHVAVALTLGQEVVVGTDQRRSTTEEESDLPDLHLLASELGAAREGGQVVGDGLGGVVHDLADLRGGLALQGQSH